MGYFVAESKLSEWKDTVAITASFSHLVGLKADGTVVAEGDNEAGQCDVSAWTDIVAIAAGYFHTLGLKSDGTVVSTQYIGEKFVCGQCDVGEWKLFSNLDTLEQERAEAQLEAERRAEEVRLEAERKAEEARLEAERRAAEMRRKAEKRLEELENKEQSILQEISGLGMLAIRRRKELERELAAVLLEQDKVAQSLSQFKE